MADEDDAAGDAEAPERKKLAGKKLIIIAVPAVLVLVGGIAFALTMLGGGKDEDHDSAETAEHDGAHDAENGDGHGDDDVALGPGELAFYELPEMLVNLNNGSSRTSYLKLKVALEVDQLGASEALEAQLPRIVDNFQIYLRELRVEELSGSAGMFRLKEELLRRVNQAVGPVRVNDVLFREMLVQ